MNDKYDKIKERLTPNDGMVLPIVAGLVVASGDYTYQEFAESLEKELDAGRSFFDIVHEIEGTLAKKHEGEMKR